MGETVPDTPMLSMEYGLCTDGATALHHPVRLLAPTSCFRGFRVCCLCSYLNIIPICQSTRCRFSAFVARKGSHRCRTRGRLPQSLGLAAHLMDINAHLSAVVQHTADMLKPHLQNVACGVEDFKAAVAGLVTENCFCAHDVDFIIVICLGLSIYLFDNLFRWFI